MSCNSVDVLSGEKKRDEATRESAVNTSFCAVRSVEHGGRFCLSPSRLLFARKVKCEINGGVPII